MCGSCFLIHCEILTNMQLHVMELDNHIHINKQQDDAYKNKNFVWSTEDSYDILLICNCFSLNKLLTTLIWFPTWNAQ